ncbi:hypothetical protein K474DRAFT_1562302, partial [Panus rudis PR-1116 ss-1]
QYIRAYNIKKSEVASTIARFLDGKAWTYYMADIADRRHPRKMSVDQFLTGLFNYCFPIDFKSTMRQRVNDFIQRDHSVKEYAYRLKMFLNLAGIRDHADRVQRLWDGFKPEIQDALWDHKMSPDVHRWKQV